MEGLHILLLELEDLVAEGRFISLVFAKVCHLCCLKFEKNNQVFGSVRWLSAYSLGLKLTLGSRVLPVINGPPEHESIYWTQLGLHDSLF